MYVCMYPLCKGHTDFRGSRFRLHGEELLPPPRLWPGGLEVLAMNRKGIPFKGLFIGVIPSLIPCLSHQQVVSPSTPILQPRFT